MMRCDNCGKPLTQMDDDSLYCMYCEQSYDNSWTLFPEPEPDEQ